MGVPTCPQAIKLDDFFRIPFKPFLPLFKNFEGPAYANANFYVKFSQYCSNSIRGVKFVVQITFVSMQPAELYSQFHKIDVICNQVLLKDPLQVIYKWKAFIKNVNLRGFS